MMISRPGDAPLGQILTQRVPDCPGIPSRPPGIKAGIGLSRTRQAFHLFLSSRRTMKIGESYYAFTAVAFGAECVVKLWPQKAVGHIPLPVNRRPARSFGHGRRVPLVRIVAG